jgi:hypothetical protein
VADELTLHAEHAHAVVAIVGDSDVPVARHEAQPKWAVYLTVTSAMVAEPASEGAVVATEHTDAVRRQPRTARASHRTTQRGLSHDHSWKVKAADSKNT